MLFLLNSRANLRSIVMLKTKSHYQSLAWIYSCNFTTYSINCPHFELTNYIPTHQNAFFFISSNTSHHVNITGKLLTALHFIYTYLLFFFLRYTSASEIVAYWCLKSSWCKWFRDESGHGSLLVAVYNFLSFFYFHSKDFIQI